MTSPFDEGKVFLPTGTVKGIANPSHQRVMVGPIDVAASKIRFHRDRDSSLQWVPVCHKCRE